MNAKLIEKIQNMSEADFTKKIVNELFRHMGYSKITYNGGPNEYGRDLIMWSENRLKDKEVAVAQVKMDKLNSNASSNHSFITVANQLAMALSRKILHEDGQEYMPVDVYFVSPQQIDTRELEMTNGIIQNKKALKFIDIVKLNELVNKFEMKDYIYSLFNEKVISLQDYVHSDVHNDELSKALAISGKKDESLYYSDLDMSFLNFTIKFSYNKVYQKNILIDFNSSLWEEFKCIYKDDKLILNGYFDTDAIEEKYKYSNSKKNLSDVDSLKSLYSKLNKFQVNINNHLAEHESKADFNKNRIKSIKNIYSECHKNISNINQLDFDLNPKLKDKLLKNAKDITIVLNNINLEKIGPLENKLVSNIKEAFEGLANTLEECVHKKHTCVEYDTYNTIVDVNLLRKYITELFFTYKNKIEEGIDVIENIKIINKAQKELLAYNKYFSNFKISIIYDNKHTTSINKKISDFLNENINILIEANAGAGKTTSLQHYSKHGNKAFLKIYLPLAKVTKNININQSKSYSIENYSDIFISSVCTYINKLSKSNVIDEKNFKKHLLKKRTVVLFDGIDEVLSKYNWIFEVIQFISNNYNATIAASTRPGFINNSTETNFIKIKLLDFTSEQRTKFVNGWFNGNSKLATKVLAHIKKNKIDNIISNPFAATIFCRLAEREMALPMSETDMYEERLRLLLGLYDEHKEISRNNIYRLDLEKVASKIAYIFHKNNLRSMPFKTIISELEDESCFPDHKLEEKVRELITPCNVLFDEYDDGEFTFGHFRYQEYLVAKELNRNRGISIDRYILNDFWIGALSLFAQITDNIAFIFDELLQVNSTLAKHKDVLIEMISKRNSKEEQKTLIEIIDKYSKIEKHDAFFHDTYEYD